MRSATQRVKRVETDRKATRSTGGCNASFECKPGVGPSGLDSRLLIRISHKFEFQMWEMRCLFANYLYSCALLRL